MRNRLLISVYKLAHKCINSKVKDATPNLKDIEIYFENFYMYKWVNLHLFSVCVQIAHHSYQYIPKKIT